MNDPDYGPLGPGEEFVPCDRCLKRIRAKRGRPPGVTVCSRCADKVDRYGVARAVRQRRRPGIRTPRIRKR